MAHSQPVINILSHSGAESDKIILYQLQACKRQVKAPKGERKENRLHVMNVPPDWIPVSGKKINYKYY